MLAAEFPRFLRRRPVMRFVVSSAICLLLGAPGLTSAEAAQMTSLKLVLPFSFQGALGNWTLAEADGCYKSHGLDLTIDGGAGSGDALTKVATGAYEIGIADFTSLLLFNAKQPEQSLVAAYIMIDRAPTSVVALKRSGISKPKDLVGKRIGDAVGEASRELFPAFAAANEIDPSSVTWINIAVNLRHTGLLRGDFDAAAGHMYTITSGLRAIGVKDEDVVVMPYADYGVDIFGNSVVVKPAWASAHAQAVKAFITCAVDGMKGAIANPQAAVDSLKPHNSMLDDKQALAELNFSNQFSVLTASVKKGGLSAVDASRLDKILGQISSAYGVPKPAAQTTWTDAYLPPESERMIAKP
jgi:NitT/TauT family transport system substrate-binding protein